MFQTVSHVTVSLWIWSFQFMSFSGVIFYDNFNEINSFIWVNEHKWKSDFCRFIFSIHIVINESRKKIRIFFSMYSLKGVTKFRILGKICVVQKFKRLLSCPQKPQHSQEVCGPWEFTSFQHSGILRFQWCGKTNHKKCCIHNSELWKWRQDGQTASLLS